MRTIHDRRDNDASRLAEDAARNRRLDRDAIVSAALDRLEATAVRSGATEQNLGVYVSSYVAGATARYVSADEVTALLGEIRAQLSPLVRG